MSGSVSSIQGVAAGCSNAIIHRTEQSKHQQSTIIFFKLLTLWIVVMPADVLDAMDHETYFYVLYFSR